MKKLDYINSLRGLAILGVIMVHIVWYGSSSFTNLINMTTSQGGRGVQLFYLASAFTLFLSYKNRLAKETFPIWNFFVRRVFRIAPIYYLGIVYYLIQDGFGPRYWLGDSPGITPLNIISNITFLHGFNPHWITSLVPGGWSIAVEMTFYAILPFLFSKIKNINQAFIGFVLSLFLSLFCHVVLKKFPLVADERLWNDYLFFYFPSQLPVFLLGIIFYFLVIQNEGLNMISGKWLLLFSGLVLVRLCTGLEHLLPSHVLFGIAFLLLGYGLSTYKFKLLVNPVINHIGTISFSMYLSHFAVIHWLEKISFFNSFGNDIVSFAAKFAIVLPITIAISTILYNIIEVPFQDLGKIIIDRWEKKKGYKEEFNSNPLSSRD